MDAKDLVGASAWDRSRRRLYHAHDLAKFATALMDGTLISEASLAAATQPQNHKGWYGYGFLVSGVVTSASSATKAVPPGMPF